MRPAPRSSALAAAGLLGVSLLASHCTPGPTPPTKVCTRRVSASCRTPSQLTELLRRRDFELVDAEDTAKGAQHARLFTLQYDGPSGKVRVRAKWRPPAPATGKNDPRKEIAAYVFQKLFLDEGDYVVPPSVGRCIPLAVYREKVKEEATATFPDTACVFGALSYWLEHVESLEDLVSAMGDEPKSRQMLELRAGPELTRTLADVNLLAYLISHGDTHWEQFVFVGEGQAMRVYSIDHTIAFSDYRNPRIEPPDDWSRIQVPALRRASVERLRRLTRADIEALAVVEQYENRAGMLVPVERGAAFGDPTRGTRWQGKRMQLGLTKGELEIAWTRLQDLLARVDRKELRVF